MPTKHYADPDADPTVPPEPDPGPAPTESSPAADLEVPVSVADVLPRAIAIDWEHTRLTPAFVRALAKAQREARTVGKDSKVEAHGETKARKYANADAMVEEATRVLADNGIAWVCASRAFEATEKRFVAECGPKQWVCSRVVTESVLLHAGEDDQIGQLVTVGETASIGRSSTPIDKADKAAETYLRLYMARDLVGLDRGDEAVGADDVNQRPDDVERGADRRAAGASIEAAKRAAIARWKPLEQLLRARDGRMPDPHGWMVDALGGEPSTAEDWQRLHTIIGEQIDALKGKVSR